MWAGGDAEFVVEVVAVLGEVFGVVAFGYVGADEAALFCAVTARTRSGRDLPKTDAR